MTAPASARPAAPPRLAPASGLLWRAWEDGTVVHVPVTGDTALLEPAAALVLDALERGAGDPAALLDDLAPAAGDGLDRDRLAAWLDGLLERLKADGVIDEAPP